MSGGARNNFDGQRWREKVIRTRVNEALAGLPPKARQMRFDEEYKRQTAIYEQERDEKRRARRARNAQRRKKKTAPIKSESESPFRTIEERRSQDAER